VALQVVDELWAHQNLDGGIAVDYPGCGNTSKSSPESTGLALLAFDPRVPGWFGHGGQLGSLNLTVSHSGRAGTGAMPLSNQVHPSQAQPVAAVLITAAGAAVQIGVDGARRRQATGRQRPGHLYWLQSSRLIVPSGIIVSQ
jgi:hypothetical protein